MAALSGVTVVSLEQAVAAPLCTSRLAADGARVIKIERPEGDLARGYDHVVHGESAYFVWLNAGKESLVADIKNSEDAALLHRILRGADVFVQNLAPGAAARAGFGSDELRAKYPRLITCDISGYGEDGAYAKMKAYDFLVQCEAGLADVTGPLSEPARVGVSVADICCGMNSHAAILRALYERETTGKGSGVAVSLFDGLADWMAVPLAHFDYGGKAPERAGLHHATIAPYGAYAAGDGKQVVFSIQNQREWRTFCGTVLQNAAIADDPRFATNPDRVANRPALDAELAKVFAGLDREGLIARLSEAAVAYGALNSVTDLSTHPALRRREVDTPTGPASVPAWPARWRGEEPLRLAVPAVGQHTDSLRKEFA